MSTPATEEQPAFYVEVRGDELAGLRFEVGTDGLLVGRSPTCDVIFESREVSRRHCYFYPATGGCFVKDLGSRNGILVNRAQAKETRLHDGDVVDVGTSRFVLRVEGPRLRRERADAPPWPEAPEAEEQPVPPVRHPLAVASVVFSLLAYVQYVFGLGGVLLALIALREMKGRPEPLGRRIARAGLVLGVAGTALNLWFAVAAPRVHAHRMEAARLQCQANLQAIAVALRTHRARHYGADPQALHDLVAEGLLDRSHVHCPGSGGESDPDCLYTLVGGGGGPAARALGVVVCDGSVDNHRTGGWALRADGRTVWLSRRQLSLLLEEFRTTGAAEFTSSAEAQGGRP